MLILKLVPLDDTCLFSACKGIEQVGHLPSTPCLSWFLMPNAACLNGWPIQEQVCIDANKSPSEGNHVKEVDGGADQKHDEDCRNESQNSNDWKESGFILKLKALPVV